MFKQEPILLLCFVTLLLAGWQTVYAQRQSSFVLPRETDAQIDTDLEEHYVAYNPSVVPRNQLFVFLPGTGAVPRNYQEISNLAADLGYHVVNLNYPNSQAVGTLCGGLNADLDCYGRVRLEIIDGADRTPLVSVNRANSIENRLSRLLLYLHARRPADGWGQYLSPDNGLKWTVMVVGGHSQGGGHAGILGRYRPLSRVIMLAAMDFNTRANALANWIAQPATTPNATPADRFFGFAHQRDELINYAILSTRAWPAYGMNSYGEIVNVDQTPPPYANSHSLNSNLDIPGGFFHSGIVADPRLVRQPDGTPVYRPVWEYLLDAPRLATTVSAASYQSGSLATESIVAVFGINLSTVTMSSATLPLPTVLGGTSIRVRDSRGSERLAPLFYVSPTQINFQLPPQTSNGIASLTITNSGGGTSISAVQIGDLAPGLFTADSSGQGAPAGYALRVKPDGTQILEALTRFDTAQNRLVAVPIDLSNGDDQVYLVLFGTGWRRRSSLSGAVLKAGGADVPVVYLGPHSDLVGLDQLNALLPRSLAGRGQVELSLSVDGLSANVLRVSFR
ncbi:MAG: BPSS1187 family protein [Acidobacteriota bacterium]